MSLLGGAQSAAAKTKSEPTSTETYRARFP